MNKPRLKLNTNGTLYEYRPGPGAPFWLIYGFIKSGASYLLKRRMADV